MSTPLMELKGIYKRFGTVEALKGVDFHIMKGEVVGLVGDNGAGKSTLAKIMVGFHQPDRGEIYFEGKRVVFKSPRDARERGIEIVYQDLALVEDMNIFRNLYLGRELTKKLGPLKLLSKRAMKEEAFKLLREIGINVRTPDDVVKYLSGGERQSIAIARAVRFGAKLLILDEPTAALSIRESEKVLEYIKDLKSRGISVVVISHNVYHVYSVADRFVVLDRGVKIADIEKKYVTAEDVIDIIARRKTIKDLGLEGVDRASKGS